MDSQIFTVLIAVAGLAAGFLLCWLVMRGRTQAPAPAPVPAPQARPELQAELTQAKERVRQLEQERQAALKNYEDLKLQTAKLRETPAPSKKDPAPAAENAAQLAALQSQLAALQDQERVARADLAKARSDAQAEQVQAKEYFRSIEQKHQLATADYQELKLQAAKSREALELAKKEQAPLAERASQVSALEARLQALTQENAALKRTAAATAPATPQARPAPSPAQATQLPVLEKQVIELQNLEKAIQKEFKLLAELQRNVTLTSATVQEFHDSPESLRSAPTAA